MDAAFLMIGRTLVNFQRLEHNLRLAAQLGPAQGTLQKVQKDVEKRKERAATLTLGQAIQTWLDYLYGQSPPASVNPDLFDVTIHLSFTLETDPESRKCHADALRKLLALRNNLIHSRLSMVDWESQEACDALVAELEEVNVSIAEQMNYTVSMIKAIADLHEEHVQSLFKELDNGRTTSSD